MIKDTYSSKKTIFSLEVFPPKQDSDISSLFKVLDELKCLKLNFISITYGAGGGTRKRTMDIAAYVQNQCNIDALAHLTSVSMNESLLDNFLEELKANNITNVLALRGDRPKDMSDSAYLGRPYKYASDLVSVIRNNSNLCVGGACYPEVHPESRNEQEDLYYLKSKIEAGTSFLITQLFFDNTKFYNFYDNVRRTEISVPISAGIMPITSPGQIKTIVDLSGACIPDALKSIFTKYENNPEDFKKAGLEYATKQIESLLSFGIQGIHLYTLNKVDVSKEIFSNLGLI